MLNGSASVFTASSMVQLDDPDLKRRCDELDLHPTGPLPGLGESGCEGDARIYEDSALTEHTDVIAILKEHGVKSARRALRVAVSDLSWSIGDVPDGSSDATDRCLTLKFSLPTGSYATVLLDEVLKPVEN